MTREGESGTQVMNSNVKSLGWHSCEDIGNAPGTFNAQKSDLKFLAEFWECNSPCNVMSVACTMKWEEDSICLIDFMSSMCDEKHSSPATFRSSCFFYFNFHPMSLFYSSHVIPLSLIYFLRYSTNIYDATTSNTRTRSSKKKLSHRKNPISLFSDRYTLHQ